MHRVLIIIAFLLQTTIFAGPQVKTLSAAAIDLTIPSLTLNQEKDTALVAWTKGNRRTHDIELTTYKNGKWSSVEKVAKIQSKNPFVKVATNNTSYFVVYENNNQLQAIEGDIGQWSEPIDLPNEDMVTAIEIVPLEDKFGIFWVEKVDKVAQCFYCDRGERIQLSNAQKGVSKITVLKTKQNLVHVFWIEDGVLKHCCYDAVNWTDKSNISEGAGVTDVSVTTTLEYPHVAFEQTLLDKSNIYISSLTITGWSIPEMVSNEASHAKSPMIESSLSGSAIVLWQEENATHYNHYTNASWGHPALFCPSSKLESIQVESQNNFRLYWLNTQEKNSILVTFIFENETQCGKPTSLVENSGSIKGLQVAVLDDGKSIILWEEVERSKKSIKTSQFSSVKPPKIVSVAEVEEEFATEKVKFILITWEESEDSDIIKYNIYLNSECKGSVSPRARMFKVLSTKGYQSKIFGVTAVNKYGEESITSTMRLSSQK